MRLWLLCFIAIMLLLSLFSCKSTSTTDPTTDDHIATLIDPESCINWLAFIPLEEFRGQYKVVWDNETQHNPVVSLTFDGAPVDLNNGTGIVSASPGQTYSGVFTADGVEYPYTIKMAYRLSNVSWNNNTTTPRISWQLPESNTHLFTEGWWVNDAGDDVHITVFLPANKREYTFPSHQYKNVIVATLNSFNSHNNTFGVYSWSFKAFSFD